MPHAPSSVRSRLPCRARCACSPLQPAYAGNYTSAGLAVFDTAGGNPSHRTVLRVFVKYYDATSSLNSISYRTYSQSGGRVNAVETT